MKALVICNRPPDPLGRGDAKIAAHAIRVLGERGHDVDVIYRRGASPLTGVIHRLMSVASGEPLQMALTYCAPFGQVVEGATARQAPNVIVAIHARVAQYIPEHMRARTFAVIIDAYGRNYASYEAIARFPRSILYRMEGNRMARYEAWLAREFGAVGVVAAIDQRLLADRTRQYSARVVHLPYAVDLAHFRPRGAAQGRPPRFLFTGRLNYFPNEDAARQLISTIWPPMRRAFSDAHLTIAGAAPSKALLRLAFQQGVEIRPDPSDLRDLMASACAMIVPMRIGGGVQTKILEAMATRLPVICTSFANSGLDATPGMELLLADDASSFIKQAAWVIERPADAAAMASRARLWVETQHSYANFADPFLSTCSRLAAS